MKNHEFATLHFRLQNSYAGNNWTYYSLQDAMDSAERQFVSHGSNVNKWMWLYVVDDSTGIIEKDWLEPGRNGKPDFKSICNSPEKGLAYISKILDKKGARHLVGKYNELGIPNPDCRRIRISFGHVCFICNEKETRFSIVHPNLPELVEAFSESEAVFVETCKRVQSSCSRRLA